MIPRKKQSILVYFVGMSLSIIIILLLFSSIALQHIFVHYRETKNSQAYMDICHSVFKVVGHYEFERGSGNVVLNYQGGSPDVATLVDSVAQQRLEGDRAFNNLINRIAALPQSQQPVNYLELKATYRLVVLLRKTYQEQLARPLRDRDSEFDDLWFNTMSRFLRQLNYLQFHIANNGQLIPEQKKLADIYYLLSQLRDYAGPVVSYLQGAFYNAESLNQPRILEIGYRREQTGYLLNELLSAAQATSDKKTIALVKDFQHSYLDTYFSAVDRYIKDVEKRQITPQRVGTPLPYGTRELEKFHTISENLTGYYERIASKAIYEQGSSFILGVMTSLALIGLILCSLYLGYKNFYKRIIANTGLLEKLVAGDLDTEIPESTVYDEIDLLQNGIQRFKDNLIMLNAANADLMEQVEQRRQSEIRLRDLSDERGLLLKEVHHRVKNNLQVISSMMSLQIRRHADKNVSLALGEAQRRINNIAIAHQMLYQSDNLSFIKSKEFFDAMITNMMAIYDAEESFYIRREVEDFSISFETAKTLSLILGEALSNIHKHAFPEQRKGNVTILLTKHWEHILLKIQDDGVGFDLSKEYEHSLGLTLITTFARTLQGEAIFRNVGGTEIMIRVKDC